MTLNMVEKAARGELRKLNIPEEKLELLDNGTQASVVAAALLKEILPHRTIPLVKKQSKNTLVPMSRDEVEAKFLGGMLTGAPIILPKNLYLKSIPYAELAACAKKRGLAIIPLGLTTEEQEALKMIRNIQAEQSQTETALLKTIEWIQTISKKPRK